MQLHPPGHGCTHAPQLLPGHHLPRLLLLLLCQLSCRQSPHQMVEQCLAASWRSLCPRQTPAPQLHGHTDKGCSGLRCLCLGHCCVLESDVRKFRSFRTVASRHWKCMNGAVLAQCMLAAGYGTQPQQAARAGPKHKYSTPRGYLQGMSGSTFSTAAVKLGSASRVGVARLASMSSSSLSGGVATGCCMQHTRWFSVLAAAPDGNTAC